MCLSTCLGKCAIGVALLQASIAHADFVANSSFEDNPLQLDTWVYQANGWIATGDAGTFRPPAAAYPDGAPLGSNVGFVQQGWGKPTGILEQETAIFVTAGTTYEVHALIGRRVDNPLIPWGGYIMSIHAGETLLAHSMTDSQPEAGTFVPAIIISTIGAGQDGLGQRLRVRFEALYGQTNIDDVRIVVTPTPGALVALVTAAISFVGRRSRGPKPA